MWYNTLNPNWFQITSDYWENWLLFLNKFKLINTGKENNLWLVGIAMYLVSHFMWVYICVYVCVCVCEDSGHSAAVTQGAISYALRLLWQECVCLWQEIRVGWIFQGVLLYNQRWPLNISCLHTNVKHSAAESQKNPKKTTTHTHGKNQFHLLHRERRSAERPFDRPGVPSTMHNRNKTFSLVISKHPWRIRRRVTRVFSEGF